MRDEETTKIEERAGGLSPGCEESEENNESLDPENKEKAQKEAKARAEVEECLADDINERKRAYEEMLKEADNFKEEMTIALEEAEAMAEREAEARMRAKDLVLKEQEESLEEAESFKDAMNIALEKTKSLAASEAF